MKTFAIAVLIAKILRRALPSDFTGWTMFNAWLLLLWAVLFKDGGEKAEYIHASTWLIAFAIYQRVSRKPKAERQDRGRQPAVWC